ncbi:DUF3019 domain-containing protein [Pseudoalteromonas xiamenensis]|uniref:DUF3019 domain-containing protein n=1 Tax=Pseudoalteromonas xiamenensis TaxID=882626 RepID=A0A975DGH1_9GAMM|nr:DUF3019 domain-containing protein [Pseudoalteromonas xiamenensis]QTH71343.1 DUF3019 domain-containing protein [Pseudoalteromonas xiamenensis]
MSFKWIPTKIWVLSLFILPQAKADNTSLSVSDPLFEVQPNICVALREGRPCYTEVTFQWQSPEASSYCIRNTETEQLIGCWENQLKTLIWFEFNETETQSYELINQQSGHTVATAEIQVQWVYTNRQKKRRWRLF